MRLSRTVNPEELVGQSKETIRHRLKSILEVYVNHDDTDFPFKGLNRLGLIVDPACTGEVRIWDVHVNSAEIDGRVEVVVMARYEGQPGAAPVAATCNCVIHVDPGTGEIEIASVRWSVT